MECLVIKSLENAFEPSILAASALGPKTGIPTTFKNMDARYRRVKWSRTFSKVGFYTVDKRLLGAWNDEIQLSDGLCGPKDCGGL